MRWNGAKTQGLLVTFRRMRSEPATTPMQAIQGATHRREARDAAKPHSTYKSDVLFMPINGHEDRKADSHRKRQKDI